MRSLLIASISDTLTKKPEYGILSSFLSISMSTTELLQTLGVIFGLFIAIITAILKVIELRDKLRARRKVKKFRDEVSDIDDIDDDV